MDSLRKGLVRRLLIVGVVGLAALAVVGTAGASSGVITITNTGGIVITDNTVGDSVPYPSTATASGDGTIAGATLTLVGFEHSYLNDLEIRLVGPDGRTVTILDNQGSFVNVCGNYTFADGGTVIGQGSSAGAVPGYCSGVNGFVPGTYGPFSSFSALVGAVLSGTWSLYVDDQASGDVGTLQAWILQILALMPDRAGYCSVAGNKDPNTGAAIAPGTFMNLELDQVLTDPAYAGATPANYVEGKGITCDAVPAGYVRDGFAAESFGVPRNTYPFFKKG